MRRPRQPHATIATALIVGIAAVVPYARSAGGYFTGDDFGLIKLLSGKSASHFPSLFTSSWTDDIWGTQVDELRPFPALAYKLDSLWGAGSPIAYHVTTIALHGACAVAVFALARWVAGLRLSAAAFSSVVFG